MQDQVKQGMLCPVCRVDLMMSERQGVEIDYCPQCRGVWLDRGELDKVIERSAAAETSSALQQPAQQHRAPEREPPGYHKGDEYIGGDYRQKPYGKRRKSWLAEIFD